MKRFMLATVLTLIVSTAAEARERKQPLRKLGKAIVNLVVHPVRTVRAAAESGPIRQALGVDDGERCADGNCRK